jgi:ribosome-associated protein
LSNWVERNVAIAPKKKADLPAGSDLLALVENSLDDDKAEDIVVIDLAGKTEIADYMVVASGQSSRQVGAMAMHLTQKIKELGIKELGIEGQSQGDWVLIDTGDVIIHLFRPEVRDFYGLEKMWSVPDVVAGNAAQANAEAATPA